MKITFITGHNWDTKRQGGFHIFAKESVLRGNDTVFFSFPRPYYGFFMKREQINKDVISTLKKGVVYDVEDDGGVKGKILNVCFPTFRLPDAAGKILPSKLMIFLVIHSFHSFKSFAKKFLFGTDCFVFESCEGIFLLTKIKKLFPNAKIIYRPSDPLVFDAVPERLKEAERKMLYAADLSLIVNEEGRVAYEKSVPDFESKVKYKILPNGVDIASYKKHYDTPELLKKSNTVLYVGAWEVEWDLLFLASEKLQNMNFVVVCPNYPSVEIIERVDKTPNFFYVPGISPKEVPAWITNCSVVMVPYKTDFYKDRPLGITAKYYQAMAAEKPIVAYHDTPKLKDVGIPVVYDYDGFLREVENVVQKKNVKYKFDLQGRDWKDICDVFLKACDKVLIKGVVEYHGSKNEWLIP